MCGSEVERKNIQEFNSTTLILLVCIYVTYVLQCGRDRWCVVVKWRGRIYNKSSISHMLLTSYSGAETDDVW